MWYALSDLELFLSQYDTWILPRHLIVIFIYNRNFKSTHETSPI
jgi:hypothetical protein